MSKYEEEKGVLVLPTAALVPLRRALIDAVNKEQEKTLGIATQVYHYFQAVDPKTGRKERLNALKTAIRKGSSVYQARDAMQKAMDSIDGAIAQTSNWYSTSRNRWNEGEREKAAEFLVPYPKQGEPLKIVTPLKKNLTFLPSSALSFSNDYCSIHIEPKTRQVFWNVPENNRAVESAEESLLGKAFLNALHKIEWTRATGGAFRHTDEYAQDSAMEYGDNPVRISRHFGPLGQKAMEDDTGLRSRRRVARPRR